MTDTALQRIAAQRGVTVDELVSRLRAVEKEYADDPSRCRLCEQKIPEARKRNSKYCADSCKTKYNRYRKG